MDLTGNPFSILTLISAPAVLTNASCVLLFGTGNRYGRAVDRVHELADLIRENSQMAQEELALRTRQLEAGEIRALLIVRALTYFYTAVAGFVSSTLISLVGAIFVNAHEDSAVQISFCLALVVGTIAVVALVGGALVLAQETRYSYTVLKEERLFLKDHLGPQALQRG